MSWRRWVVANGSPVWIWRLGIGQTQNSILDPSWTIPMEGYAIWTHQWASQFYQIDESSSELTSTHCLAYLDDIIIWTPPFEEHLRRLGLLFDRIRTATLKLKPTQCQFLKRELSFLGHVVSSKGIKTDSHKVESVRPWPIPVDIKEFQSFIGLAIYYKAVYFWILDHR